MPATLELDNGQHITYESAIKKDENIINEATYPRARKQLFQQRGEDACIIEDQWIRGSFNVSIPVEVRSAGFNQNLIFRCPMPHKLAEATYPGTIDEKLSSEVGTYVWMQERTAKEAIKEKGKRGRKRKNAVLEAEAEPEVTCAKEVIKVRGTLGRKRKSAMQEGDEPEPEPEAAQKIEAPQPWRAPVAQMI